MIQSERTESILVLGAGELGIEVLRHLARQAQTAQGARIRINVLLRPSTANSTAPAKKREINELKKMGIGIAEGDVVAACESELAATFAPYDTVISCIGFSAGPGTQTKITRAVLRAGVKRYVPWQFGVDYDKIGRGSAQDVFDEQLDVRDLLRSQHDTEWLIVATGMFTSFLFEPSFGVVDIESDAVHALGSWDNQVTVTTPEDIGRLTAAILCHAPRFVNETVFVAGDTISYGELADEIESALKRPLSREAWSVSSLKDALNTDPDNNLLKYHAVFAAGVGVAWSKTSTFNHSQGVETTDIPTWIQRHLIK